MPVPARRFRIVTFLGLAVVAPLSATAQVTSGTGFAPGARTIIDLNFAGTPVGQFPQGLQPLPGAKLEVVNKDGVHMLRASSPSEFVLPLPEALPKNFTLEIELIPKACCNPVDLAVEGVVSGSRSAVSAQLEWDPDHFMIVGGNPVPFQMDMPAAIGATLPSTLTTVALSFEDETVNMYTNGQRVYTLSGRKFVRGSVLRISLGGTDDDKYAVYLARVRVADMTSAIVATNAPQAGPRSVATGAPAPGTPTPTLPNVSGQQATSTSGASTGSTTQMGVNAVLTGTATPIPATTAAPPPQVSSPSALGPRPATSPTVNAGPAPTGFAVLNSTPASVSLGWNAAAGAVDYTLLRTTGAGQPWVTLTQAAIPGVQYTDANALDHRVAYTYRLQANYSGTPPGYVDLNVTLPAPQDPAGFTGIASLPASVHLSWQPVPGASSYLVNGPGLAGTTVTGTSFVVPNAPGGNNVYRVASVYGAAGVLTPAASWPTATVRVAPPFLSLINGPGNSTLGQQHNALPGVCWDGWSPGCTSPVRGSLNTLFRFWGAKSTTSPEITHADVLSETITFADVADLGFGRRVWCGRGPGSLLCIANSHGPAPDAAGANSAQQNADAATLNVASRSYTVISKQYSKFGGRFFFYQFTYPNGVDPTTDVPDPGLRFYLQMENSSVMANGVAIPSTLDSQGPKFAPHVCLSCHGGRFNPADNSVVDGSLLPIDPSRVVFSTLPGATRADQEKKIQSMNSVIRSGGTTTVGEYIDKMYGGNGTLPARDDIVPAGWTGQQALWTSVVRPYCIMCHMAQQGPLAFASFSDMMSVKDKVQKSVCTDGTMPHSEIAFRQFWTAKGSVLPADMLSTALGFKSCP